MRAAPKKATWIGMVDNSEVLTVREGTTTTIISIHILHLSCPCSLIFDEMNLSSPLRST